MQNTKKDISKNVPPIDFMFMGATIVQLSFLTFIARRTRFSLQRTERWMLNIFLEPFSQKWFFCGFTFKSVLIVFYRTYNRGIYI